MLSFLKAHELLIGGGLYWLFSVIVSTAPMPKPTDSPFYVWMYGFCHALAGSLGRVAPLLVKNCPVLAALLGTSADDLKGKSNAQNV